MKHRIEFIKLRRTNSKIFKLGLKMELYFFHGISRFQDFERNIRNGFDESRKKRLVQKIIATLARYFEKELWSEHDNFRIRQ